MKSIVYGSCRTFVLGLAALLVACGGGGSSSTDSAGDGPTQQPPAEPSYTYDAEVVWTEYGIPHISASDLGSLAYGTTYAYAQQNYCLAMRRIVQAAGESARYLGGAVEVDTFNRFIKSDERIRRLYFDEASEAMIAIRDGMVAGLNRYLGEVGVENLAEGEHGCRNAEWVREVDAMDIARIMDDTAFQNSPLPGFLGESIFRAQPPTVLAHNSSPRDRRQALEHFDREQFIASVTPAPSPLQVGSNGYAIGGDATPSGAGLVFSNPHDYWEDHNFFIAHQTLGDELDVMGTLTVSSGLVFIGFNRDVGWTHTYSYGRRFMAYELELNPENPLQYIYEGEVHDFIATTTSADYVDADGTVRTFEHTYYSSHLGPLLDPGSSLGGWPTPMGTVLTVYLPQLENNRYIDQHLQMARARNTEELTVALRSMGLGGMHTMAADRYGDAFFGDIAVTPNITLAQYEQCVRGPLASALTDATFPTLDGSDPDCAPGNDPDTPMGILGFDNMPQLHTREYVANANNGFWLANPRVLLEGFPDFMGGRYRMNASGQQVPRARQLFLQAEERLNGTDDLGPPGFTVDNIRELMFGSRSIMAEHMVDDLVEICQPVADWSPYSSDPASVGEACDILTTWDQRFLVDSVGAHIFREFATRFGENRAEPWPASLYATAFDLGDPFKTPRGLRLEGPWAESAKTALVEAVDRVLAAGIPLDRPWGEVQFIEKGGERYPLAGGPGGIMLNVVESAKWEGQDFFLANGYAGLDSNEFFGNTYVSAVSWDESDCPDAYAILTYSQSTDPASDHYADATELYSQGGWIDLPFCERDIEEQELRRETVQE